MATAQAKLPDLTKPTLGYKSFKDRKTEELFFVFVEPLGGGAKEAARLLEEKLKSHEYEYEINNIEVSNIIAQEAKSAKLPQNDFLFFRNHGISPSQRAKHIFELQEWGNELRKLHGNDFLAKQIIRNIAKFRREHGFEQADDSSVKIPKSVRVAHIVRSLKHEAELELLKAVYGNMLIVVAVSGTYDQHLLNHIPNASTTSDKENRKNEFDILYKIDQYDGKRYGQRVRKIFFKANIFLKNDLSSIKSELNRFLRLLFDLEVYSPSHHERMMYEAFSAGLMSTCLSRQVGAAISNREQELVSTGWNGVPRFGGGLATDANGIENSALCKTKGHCNSNKKINELVTELYTKLIKDGLLLKKTNKYDFKEAILDTSISSLIEFSRAIHAEMEAIISASRNGKSCLREANIFVTTYPCENCVKHILAAGISSVIFIEPYPKSRAKDFFSEFIADPNCTETAPDEHKKLQFIQFVGIAPISFPILYEATERKDENGVLIRHSDKPMPKLRSYLDSYTLYEQQIASELINED